MAVSDLIASEAPRSFSGPVSGPAEVQRIGEDLKAQRIKIVRVIARLNVGGPAIHAILLTEGLDHDSMRSVLVTGRVDPSEADMLYFAKERGVAPLIIPELGQKISWWQDLITLWKLYRLLLQERPQVVHTHTAKAGTLGRLAAVLARIPVRVHTFHGHVFHGYFGRLKAGVFVWIERILARFTTRIVAISTQQAAELSDRYRIAPRAKFAVIPLGLDIEPFLRSRPPKTEAASRNGQIIVIGMIGRLVQVKNHKMALRVCAQFVDNRWSDCAIKLVIIGDGELRSDLEQQSEVLGLRTIVSFDGWRTDLTKAYWDLDMVLVTSLNEGTPLTLLEAMASGLPFVATRVGGIPDLMVGAGKEQWSQGPAGSARYWIYDNGILVEPEDVNGCAAAILYLASDAVQRQHMGEAGRRFVEIRHNKDRLLQDIRALYKQLVFQEAVQR